jgi:hypothetical protein
MVGAATEVLVQPVEARTDLHPGHDAAAIGRTSLAAQQRPAAGRVVGLVHPGMELAAEHRVPGMAAGTDDDRAVGLDGDGLGAFIDVAVRPEAFQPLPGLGVFARGVACPHPDNTARGVLDHLVHVPVEHELYALLACRILQTARHRAAAVNGIHADTVGRDRQLPRAHRAGAFRVGDAGILLADRSGLDIGLVTEGEEHRGCPRP